MSKLVNWRDELNYFLDRFMLSGLGNFGVDCPIFVSIEKSSQ